MLPKAHLFRHGFYRCKILWCRTKNTTIRPKIAVNLAEIGALSAWLFLIVQITPSRILESVYLIISTLLHHYHTLNLTFHLLKISLLLNIALLYPFTIDAADPTLICGEPIVLACVSCKERELKIKKFFGKCHWQIYMVWDVGCSTSYKTWRESLVHSGGDLVKIIEFFIESVWKN